MPDEFLNPLVQFLNNTQSHIATLNYDNLLYQSLIERNVLSGYDGDLVDGFHRTTGFDESNMERLYNRNFGYYLHLHGSLLFVDQNGRIVKISQGDMGLYENSISPHIVLTHVKHKPTVIDSSPLLRAYWKYFNFAINESEHIVVFGYSGEDIHLNSLIKSQTKNRNIIIVEWEGCESWQERNKFWIESFITKVKLHHTKNILDFTDWPQ